MRKLLSFSTLAVAALTNSLAGGAASACDGYRVVSRRVIPTRTVYRTTYQPTLTAPSVVEQPMPRVTTKTVSVSRPVEVVEQQIEIVQVDDRPLVQAGTTLQLNTLFLGDQAGYVFLKFGGVSHRCRIDDWNPEQVTFSLPSLDITEEVEATIDVVRPDGTAVKSREVKLAGQTELQQIRHASTQSVITR